MITTFTKNTYFMTRALFLIFLIQLGAAELVGAKELDPNKILTDKSTIFLAQINLTILKY